jgi:hypothetical protein
MSRPSESSRRFWPLRSFSRSRRWRRLGSASALKTTWGWSWLSLVAPVVATYPDDGDPRLAARLRSLRSLRSLERHRGARQDAHTEHYGVTDEFLQRATDSIARWSVQLWMANDAHCPARGPPAVPKGHRRCDYWSTNPAALEPQVSTSDKSSATLSRASGANDKSCSEVDTG